MGAAAMFEQYPDVVTVKDLCEMLHVGRNTAYGLVQSGLIPAVLVGRQYRIRKIDIASYFLVASNAEKCYNESNQYRATLGLSSERRNI